VTSCAVGHACGRHLAEVVGGVAGVVEDTEVVFDSFLLDRGWEGVVVSLSIVGAVVEVDCSDERQHDFVRATRTECLEVSPRAKPSLMRPPQLSDTAGFAST